MQDVFVVGTGITRFGKFPDRSLRSLGREAALAALRSAGVAPGDIEVISCGSARSGILQARESGVGQMIGWELGINEIPVYNVKAYCASGSSAFNVAYMAVAGGFHDVALVVGLEKLSDRPGGGKTLTSDGVELEGDLGFTPPAWYASAARRHMEEFGTTREQMAMVAVKNRAAGMLNPIAQYTKPITVEDVLASRPVVGPLQLLDCCPTGDGAASVVLMSKAAAERFGHRDPVKVAASVMRTGLYEQVKDLHTFQLDVNTVARAYESAGVSPEDVNVAEVHDAFTIAEIIHYEDLGFCKKGEGGRLVEDGVTALGGRLPISVSGGLMTKGHPLGATGVAQIIEITEQLRGTCGARQVEGAKVGLAQVSGGFVEGDLATCTITILTR
jgi:acetyl-CoA acyltransferase